MKETPGRYLVFVNDIFFKIFREEESLFSILLPPLFVEIYSLLAFPRNMFH